MWGEKDLKELGLLVSASQVVMLSSGCTLNPSLLFEAKGNL